jgi:ABC-type polar amino acid transport system ATPase subunit
MHNSKHIYNLVVSKKMGDFSLNISLEDLVSINYLVGESGSGKSLFLDCLYREKNEDGSFILIKDSVNMIDFWGNLDGVLNPEGLIQNYLEMVNSGRLILDILDPMMLLKEVDLRALKTVIDQEIKSLLLGMSIDDSLEVSNSYKIYNLLFWIIFKIKNSNCSVILIDEPEVHLHPSVSKYLPEILELLAKNYHKQFIIATHSPFVVSSVAKLTYKQTAIKQSVYFFKNGQLIDKYNQHSKNANRGYWGQKLIPLASSLLGAGFADFFVPQSTLVEGNAPILILCEGEGSDQDAKVYNQIFKDHNPTCLFVSCKGSSQLYSSFNLINQIKPGLSGNFDIYMIRDRDADFPTHASILEWEKDNPNAKVLDLRAIECYLFNSQVALKLNKEHGQPTSKSALDYLDKVQLDVHKEVINGVKTSLYKEKLAEAFNKATHYYLDNTLNISKHYEYLAKFITPDLKIYQLLEKDIFD